MGFFCEECGSLLEKDVCTNPNCVKSEPNVVPKLKNSEYLHLDNDFDEYKIDDFSTTADIPLKGDSFHFLCFSDWNPRICQKLTKKLRIDH